MRIHGIVDVDAKRSPLRGLRVAVDDGDEEEEELDPPRFKADNIQAQ